VSASVVARTVQRLRIAGVVLRRAATGYGDEAWSGTRRARHTLLVALALAAVALDRATGGSGTAAIGLAPMLVFIARHALPGRDATIWTGAIGTALVAGLAASEPIDLARFGVALALAAPVAAWIAVRVTATASRLDRETAEARAAAADATRSAERQQRRFAAFAAMPGNWYWETAPEGDLAYVDPAFMRHLGLAQPVPGATLEALLRIALPEARGLDEIAATMAQRVPLTRRYLSYTARGGAAAMLRFGGYPVHAPNGTFLGYRGSVREFAFDPRAFRPFRAPQRLRVLARDDDDDD